MSFSKTQTLQAAAGANGNGLALDTADFNWAGVQITGTFVATVNFEASLDGTNYVTIAAAPVAGGASVTTATAPGVWKIDVSGIRYLRARISGWASGAVTVQARCQKS